MCFSLVKPRSFEHIKTNWKPELLQHRPQAYIILIGTKLDLRDDKDVIDRLEQDNEKPITPKQGLEMAKEIEAIKYMECSSWLQEGIHEIFEEAVRIYRNRPVKEKKNCILL